MSKLKQELASGVIYSALSRYSGVFVTLIVTAVLARNLSPEEFGVVAIATVFITFFNMLSNMGFGPAIVQNKELSQEDLNNIFSFTTFLSFFSAILFFASSYIIANFYENQLLVSVCQILSLNVFFSTLNIVPHSLLLKDKNFKLLSIRTTVVQLLTGIISMIAAVAGFGIYALLISPVLSSILMFFINFRNTNLQFNFSINFISIKKILSFSVFQFLFNFINYFSRNLDNLLIGKYMGTSALGFYEKSYKLMTLPLANITFIITPVMQPIFSSFRDDKDLMYKNYLKVVWLLAMIGFPLSVLLYFSAEEIVLIVFGDQWKESIPVFKILALSVGIQVILSTSGSIFQAANNTKLLFLSGLLSCFFLVSSILIGVFLFKSLNDIAYGIVIAFFINFLQTYYILIKTILNNSFSKFLEIFFKPIFLYSLPLVIALITITPYITNLSIYYSFFVKALVSSFVYILFLIMTNDYKSIINIKARKVASV